MPKKIKTKYHLRPDGRIETTKVYDGKQKHFYGHSDEEIDAKIAEYEAALKAEENLDKLAERWWSAKEPTLSPNTVCGYKAAIKRITEHFKDVPVKDVSVRDIVAFLNEFAAKKMSQKVISNTRSVLKQVLDMAIIEGLIENNPAISLPTVKGKAKEPRQAASDEDVQRIEAHKTDSNIGRMFYFMIYSGLRLGEAIALKQKDIDRRKGCVTVRQSCAWETSSRPVLKSPKTEAGNRTVYVPKFALEVIPKYSDKETFVFYPSGLPNRHRIEFDIDAFRSSAGISCTAHQLRHKYASILHSAGVDVKDAQYLLGHSDISMTQNIYTHLEEQHKKDVSKQINAYIARTSSAKSSKRAKRPDINE